MPSTSSYVKMISGLIFVVILIFLLFFVLKIFFKKQLFSDIPGSGRLLGKVDLDLRKSLYFYEIGDVIYIIGILSNTISSEVSNVNIIVLRVSSESCSKAE